MVIKEKTEYEKFTSYSSSKKLIFAILIAHQSLFTLVTFVLSIVLPTIAYILNFPNPPAYLITILIWLLIAGLQTLAIFMNPKKWLLNKLID